MCENIPHNNPHGFSCPAPPQPFLSSIKTLCPVLKQVALAPWPLDITMLTVCFSTSAVLCLEAERFIASVRRPAHKRDNLKVKCTFYPHHFQSLVNESCYAKIRRPLVSLVAVTSWAITEMASICCSDSQFLSGQEKQRVAFLQRCLSGLSFSIQET